MNRYDPYTDKFLRDTQYNIHGTNCISRQALLDKFEPWLKVKDYNDGELNMLKAVLYEIRFMRPAQPEIIRCGQCKYAEVADKEDAQDGYTCQFHRGSIWFSGSYCSWAERRTDGRFNQQTGGD